MLNPQSYSRLAPSTPQLLDAIVKLEAFESLIALTRFIGTPLNPKPPTRRKDPSFTPSIALRGSLYIFEKQCNFLSVEASIVDNR